MPYSRRPRPVKPPDRVPAALAMLAADAQDRPFGVVGEFTAARSAAPDPAPPPPIEIPPPPWAEDLRVEEPAPAPAAPLDAVAAIKAESGDEWPTPELGPPLRYEPLRPVTIPEVDWREEQRERTKSA